MLSIENYTLEETDKLSKYILNYPIIKSPQNTLTNQINEIINCDIQSFKDARQQQIYYETIKPTGYHYITMTESRTKLNQNNLLSIVIEYSQLIGIYEITYIKSYNYDLNTKKEININDIFSKETDYIELINKEIKNQIELKKEYFDIHEEDFIGISSNQVFYLEEDGITICFSSYEMHSYCPEVFEFKLLFKDYESHLSKYTLRNIYKP